MSTPAENTKIELVTEAIEQLAIAVAQGIVLASANPINETTPELIALQRADARQQMREALATLLKPTLRIVQ